MSSLFSLSYLMRALICDVIKEGGSKIDIEYDSYLSNISDGEIDDSGTMRPYMYGSIRRESD